MKIKRKVYKQGNAWVISIPTVLFKLGVFNSNMPFTVKLEDGKLIIFQETKEVEKK